MKSGMMSFKDRVPNVKANPLHAHEMHKTPCTISDCEHDHADCAICSINPRGCPIVKRDIQKLMDENVIQIQQSRDIDNVNVIILVFTTPERVVIQFDSSNSNSVNRSNGQEVSFPMTNFVVNIVDIAKMIRSGRVFGPIFPKDGVKDVSIGKKVDVPVLNPVGAPKCQYGESSNLKPSDDDEVLRLIKKSEFNMVEQLLQTPSKISMMSLLMNSEAHREALQRLLEQALFSREKGKEAEKGKGQKARERRLKEGKAWSSEIAGFTQVELDRSRSRESHCRSGNSGSGHTRMALGNTRMIWLVRVWRRPYAYG
ncbi:hypothetical protein KIW84_025451 [Lathyrus oleraceus]|uniref:Uncharacterized protein n=1 Tax=Pisum sativum TaxID=3888 RepID=A0A9D4YJ87_PEA|nr:hypothetical protein KIW84_025451 [Pisum sativum]